MTFNHILLLKLRSRLSTHYVNMDKMQEVEGRPLRLNIAVERAREATSSQASEKALKDEESSELISSISA